MAHHDSTTTPDSKKRAPMKWRLLGAVLGLVTATVILLFVPARGGTPAKSHDPRTLNTFEGDLAGDRVETIQFVDGDQSLKVTLTDASEYTLVYPAGYADDITLKAIAKNIPITTKARQSGGNAWDVAAELLRIAFSVGLIVGVLLFLRRGVGGFTSLGKDKTRPVEVPDVGFADVAGCDEAIEDLREAAQFLTAPERFRAAGARVPRGILLVGPPGTGKTLLARAIAGECKAPFFSLSGPDFMETFVGVGAKRVRDLFAQARSHSRAIIFIDEIDALGKKRTSTGGSNPGGDERENTLNQLLVEMDGFTQTNIIVIAATNRPDVLDEALLRPGRFDRRVVVPLPDVAGRQRILALYGTKYHLGPDVDLGALARRTPGFTGADLANILNEAAIECARNERTELCAEDLSRALSLVAMGRERRSAVITDTDRQITAFHEAGHVVAALRLERVEPPVEVSIIPRGAAGGVTWLEAPEDQFLTRSAAQERLVLMLSGRAAETLLLHGDFTQGAADDINKATLLALHMVCQWGMGQLGWVSVSGDPDWLLRDERIQAAVKQVLDEAQQRAETLISANRDLLHAVAARLLDVETLRRDDLMAIAAEHG